jgi:hypothetical protein
VHLSLWHDLQQRLGADQYLPECRWQSTKEETMTLPRLKYFGWGREGEGITPDEEAFVWARITERFRIGEFDEIKPPRLDEIELHPPRVKSPATLGAIASTERYDRAAHTYGKSYPDYVRGLLGDYSAAPDVIAYPRNEGDVATGISQPSTPTSTISWNRCASSHRVA